MKDIFEDLSKEELIKVLKMFAKNWLTVDGLWFSLVEGEFGLDTALRLDEKMWERNSQIEAKRIKETLKINEKGVKGVVKAFNFLTSLPAFNYKLEVIDDKKAVFSVTGCVPQEMRLRAGKELFPCRNVTIILFSNFAKVIDPDVKIRCIFCPPEKKRGSIWCKWELYSNQE
ncbi:MAG: DUF6125 family protein [Thermodesulfobacteriota bacterium]|nr:DUF6125 family protein [Thermodesulfobacteriota bacterium]